ncbi:hypothetical protein [Rubripirellula tenax]|nr:hypothetical protein [Rubripirellula tenax]
MNNRSDATEQSTDDKPYVRVQFSISTLLYIMIIAAIGLAVYNISPDYKLLSGLNVVCAGFAFASASHITGIWPFSDRLTLTELVALFLCCLILNGLRIPPVTTH